MKVTYKKTDFLKTKGDALIVPVYSNWKKDSITKSLDKVAGGTLVKRLTKSGFGGKFGESFVFQNFGDFGFENIFFMGLGSEKELDAEKLWDFGHAAVNKVRSPAVKNLAMLVNYNGDMNDLTVLSKLSLGVLSGTYRFDKYKKDAKKNTKADLKAITFIGTGKNALSTAAGSKAVKRGEIVGESVNLARDLVNEPAETLTPVEFAKRAKSAAKASGFTCKVETEKAIEKKKMGLFMAVARGSKNPPRLVTMTHSPEGATGKPIVLVGKGLMYDSGGYSLKPSASMETMKCDMAGSAAVVGAMNAIAKLGIKKNVIGIVAACENLIGGNAYRVGDIFTGMDGTSVEVLNTDAEGRLTLADALCYAKTFKPSLIVDLATLTGACVVALGEQTTGVFASDAKVADQILTAFGKAGEDAWELPLNKRLKKLIKSKIADLRNIGGRWGGAITAGLFLQAFVPKEKWAHLDIAGPAFHSGSNGHMPQGASGVGVATLVELVDPSK